MRRFATDSDCGAATETAAEKYLWNERVGSSVAGEISPAASHASHHLAVAIAWAGPCWSSIVTVRTRRCGKSSWANFCWAHVRRDFVRVGKDYPELKDWALVWLLRIRELYCLNRERLRHAPGTSERVAAESTLQQHVATMAAQRDSELAVAKLREPCRKVLQSLTEHWDGLTLFVNDPRIPMDNNYGATRLVHGT